MSTERPPADGPAGRSAGPLDPTDAALLAELRRDGRISIRALAERTHISRSNAYTRVSRMVEDGTIRGFSAEVDPHSVGLGTTAYVAITIDQTAWRLVAAGISEIPYVEHFALIGGDNDVLALVRAPDNTALRDVVLDRIQDIPGVRTTRTWLVFEERTGRGVPYGDGEG
ncbi:Lrp/AsnC family transcriptional regulator [Couchioplanes caeruleus]|uniref:AsnC family transcriptional regulator n=2 Tax=Couchioplanes caeruleus TaxID=56438 RepID=A0A1K0FPS7_9ACTN|nr:Lrp/AsnC family transcriptional regulator [Couchioplanes caeruleus]OJF14845.1 AsnC family transcriptional regulator [Couchioplanes caeruleus subsp. caeruleus]